MIYNIKSIVHETQKAILFETDQGDFWCPKALITCMTSNEVGIYDQFNPQYINKPEENFDDLFEEIKEDPVIIQKPTHKITDEDLDWLLDPNWEPKAIYYNGVKVK